MGGVLRLDPKTKDGWGVVSGPAAPTKSFSLTQYLFVNGLYCSALVCVWTFLAVFRVLAVAAEVIMAQKATQTIFQNFDFLEYV